MAKFRKKPVVIEAWRYGYEGLPMPKWLVEAMDEGIASYQAQPSGFSGASGGTSQTLLAIETLEGIMQASPGDWIIRGVEGEIYPCKASIFEQTYEAVE